MASRKIDSGKAKRKFSMYRRIDSLAVTQRFEVGPPLQSEAANLEALIEDNATMKPASVPKFEVVKTFAVIEPQPVTGGKKHKDIQTSDFVEDRESLVALKQDQVPFDVIWDDLLVTFAEGPHNFWVAEAKVTKDFDNLSYAMNLFYNKHHAKYEELPYDSLKEGGFYAVRVNGIPGEPATWARCIIFKLVTHLDSVTTHLVDTGETVRALPKNFRRLRQAFVMLPIRAYQVTLKDLGQMRDTEENCERFKKLADGEIFSGVVRGFPGDTGGLKKFQIYLVGVNGKTLENEWIHYEFE